MITTKQAVLLTLTSPIAIPALVVGFIVSLIIDAYKTGVLFYNDDLTNWVEK